MPKVSILIATLNRSNHLVRQLSFYSKISADFEVCIIDSSRHNCPLTEFAVEELSRNISINYKRIAGLNDREAIWELVNNCRQPFCAYNGDDDFLLPGGISAARYFLENNAGYRVAHGKSRLFVSSPSVAGSSILSIGEYWGEPQRDEVSPIERLERFSRSYFVPLFSLHRTQEFLADWSFNRNNPSRTLGGELLPNFLTIARGKAKFIDVPYLVRQSHPGRNVWPYVSPIPFDVLRNDRWFEGLEVSIEALGCAISEQTGISLDDSKKMAENYFRTYFEGWMRNKYGKSYSPKVSLKYVIASHSPAKFISIVKRARSLFSNRYYSARCFFKNESKINGLLKECISVPLSELLPGSERYM